MLLPLTPMKQENMRQYVLGYTDRELSDERYLPIDNANSATHSVTP